MNTDQLLVVITVGTADLFIIGFCAWLAAKVRHERSSRRG